MNGLDEVDRENKYTLSSNAKAKEYSIKLRDGKLKNYKRKYSLMIFSHHVIRLWNLQTQGVVKPGTLPDSERV